MAIFLVVYRKEKHIAYITLNRPGKLNAINLAMIKELQDIWIDFVEDSEMRVAIITGNGKSFCAGSDIEELSSMIVDVTPSIPGLGVHVWKPIIGAINGYAYGTGLILAMQCDIRIASENAQFAYPESKIGLSGGLGADLTKYIPLGITMEILLTGEPITARRAYEVGFVNRVTTDEELLPVAREMAKLISENAPLTLKALKSLAYMGTYSAHREEAVIQNELIKPQFQSEDRIEGARAFREKEKPHFKGI